MSPWPDLKQFTKIFHYIRCKKIFMLLKRLSMVVKIKPWIQLHIFCTSGFWQSHRLKESGMWPQRLQWVRLSSWRPAPTRKQRNCRRCPRSKCPLRTNSDPNKLTKIELFVFDSCRTLGNRFTFSSLIYYSEWCLLEFKQYHFHKTPPWVILQP